VTRSTRTRAPRNAVPGVCKDCPSGAPPRLVDPPGPRCADHHRAQRDKRRAKGRERTVAKYGLTTDEFKALKAWQGGTCFICRRAKGIVKELAIDHDHDLELPDGTIPREAVRALLCGPHNQLIGELDVASLRRAIQVLEDPPARRFFRMYEHPAFQEQP
jgi:hypothetical protein